jgi:hypothetical protein
MEKVWEIIALVCTTIVAGLLLLICLADKKVDDYYLSNAGSNTLTCVYAHWTWHTDEKAFCTNDVPMAIEQLKELKKLR